MDEGERCKRCEERELRERMTEPQFAERIGLCHKTVAELRRAGRVNYRRAGRKIYYLEEDVALFDEAARRDAKWNPKRERLSKAS
jgi:hypothetical protein